MLTLALAFALLCANVHSGGSGDGRKAVHRGRSSTHRPDTPPPSPPPTPPLPLPPGPPLPQPPPWPPYDPPEHKVRVRRWFDEIASRGNRTHGPLHRLSAWGYLTPEQFEEIVADGIGRMEPPILPNATLFELGCGVGATLKAIRRLVPGLRPAGCDISARAVDVAAAEFPTHASRFAVADMARHRGCNAPDASFDHVVSFGALAMYLELEEMRVALREAGRIARPGASLLFTHFVERAGDPIGTIVSPVDKDDLLAMAEDEGLVECAVHPMVHQGERYMLACRSSTPPRPPTPPPSPARAPPSERQPQPRHPEHGAHGGAHKARPGAPARST